MLFQNIIFQRIILKQYILIINTFEITYTLKKISQTHSFFLNYLFSLNYDKLICFYAGFFFQIFFKTIQKFNLQEGL